MGIVSGAMLIISGVYLALGLMYLRYWFDERSRKDYLAFSIACLGTMCFAIFERGMMTATTGADYLYNAYWSFYPGTVAVISIAWFGYKYLHGSKWLFVTYAGLRILATILHMLMPNGINFRQVNDVGYNTFWGEPLSYPIAVANPWMVIPHTAHVLLVILFLQASFRCWRRGEFWKALTFGMGTILFSSTILVFAVTVLWGLASIPLVMAFAVGFIVAPMFYELNYDMHRAAMLKEKLEEREARLSETLELLQLSAAAGNVGMWTRRVGEDDIWVSEKAGEIWGLPSGESFTRKELFQHVHPDDRELFVTISREMDEGRKSEFQLEYRTHSQDGNIRWLRSSGKVEPLDGTRIIRGAIADITELKLTESRLTDSLEKLRLAASAANVGLWTRKIGGELVWASDEAAEMWGFEPGEQFTQSDFIQHVHLADRPRFSILFQELDGGRNDYQLEYRILLKDGNIRWIYSQGKVDEVDGSRIVRGAIVDITKQKTAENAVRELSHKLINTQENERARVARELHDGLNQNIAVLALQMGMLRKQPKDLAFVSDQLGKFVSDVELLSRDVHRISYELHPAKLTQLGLEAAIRGFCREFSAKQGLEIDFTANDLTHVTSQDISLCLYRVTQESLQNIVKHSEATMARVGVTAEGDEVVLTIVDNGKGFDVDTAKAKGGLGLVSIDERARHVNGRSAITSAPGEGARIEVRIPIDQ